MNEVDGSRAINYRLSKKPKRRATERGKERRKGGIMRARERESERERERERERDDGRTDGRTSKRWSKKSKLAASFGDGGKLSGTAAAAWQLSQVSPSDCEFSFDFDSIDRMRGRAPFSLRIERILQPTCVYMLKSGIFFPSSLCQCIL